MRVDFAQFVSPRPLYCAYSCWEIDLASDCSDHFIYGGHDHGFKHIPIVAGVDVGRVVTYNRGNG